MEVELAWLAGHQRSVAPRHRLLCLEDIHCFSFVQLVLRLASDLIDRVVFEDVPCDLERVA